MCNSQDRVRLSNTKEIEQNGQFEWLTPLTRCSRRKQAQFRQPCGEKRRFPAHQRFIKNCRTSSYTFFHGRRPVSSAHRPQPRVSRKPYWCRCRITAAIVHGQCFGSTASSESHLSFLAPRAATNKYLRTNRPLVTRSNHIFYQMITRLFRRQGKLQMKILNRPRQVTHSVRPLSRTLGDPVLQLHSNREMINMSSIICL